MEPRAKVNYIRCQFTLCNVSISTLTMSEVLPVPTKRLRNDLWNRYTLLGKLGGWRKEKFYQELKKANVEQRFTKTAIKPGYDLYNMHPALRDVLIDNGLMTVDEWRSGQFKMNMQEWLTFYSTFEIVAKPLGQLMIPPSLHQVIQQTFYPQPV